jgi:hypothetical protein
MLAEPLTDAELEALRKSVNRQAPFGEPQWQFNVSNISGLASRTRRLGRRQRLPHCLLRLTDWTMN